MAVGLPDPDTGKCPTRAIRPIWNQIKGMTVTASTVRGATVLDLTIPWKGLDCPPARQGRTFGFNLTHISHSARGNNVRGGGA